MGEAIDFIHQNPVGVVVVISLWVIAWQAAHIAQNTDTIKKMIAEELRRRYPS